MQAATETTIEFWFGQISKENPIPTQACMQRWWTKDSRFDLEIKQRFEKL